ncbi:MAG TPA: EAL domain-containing protein [Micromonosporaceae bacterium]
MERVELSAEIARRGSEEYFQTLVRNTTDVILIMNEDGALRYATPSAAALFGAAPSPGVTLDELIPPGDRGPGTASYPGRVSWGGGEGTDWTVRRADGTTAEVEASYQDLRSDPSVRGVVLTLRDVTEQRRLEQELMRRAFHDSLTGLPNRALFHNELNRAVTRSRDEGRLVAVLFVDVDDLKVVNDTLGHDAGDQLLLTVARRLEEVTGPHDIPARLGGDEFAVLLDEVGSADAADALAERISSALARPVYIGDLTLTASASIGVATSAEADDSDELLRHADLAVYVAKAAGKGQWRRYQATRHAALVRRLNIRGELDRALAGHAFELRYQPIVELDTGRAAGFEALLRWEQPEHGTIPPEEIIAAAEESGLIVPIGDWVLANATADATRWRARTPTTDAPYLSVNVSAVQFLSAALTERIHRTLADTGLPASALMIEITESVLLRDDEQVRANLRALRESGVRVAIDDFGTGYSSLSYLSRVSVDVLKLDRSFVEPIAASPQHRTVVETIVRLGQTLGLDVVAEGVEQPRQRDILIDMGCQYGQGYLFSAPMTYDEVVRYR